MIERIKEFFEDKMIRKVLRKASADIFTKNIEFEYLEKQYCKKKSSMDNLLMYCVLTVASERTPRSKEQKFDEVKILFYEKLKLAIQSNSVTSVMEVQRLEAGIQFLQTKLERLSAEELMEFDEYSESSMIYKMEIARKGAITPELSEFIKKQSSELEALDKKIMKLTAEKNKN